MRVGDTLGSVVAPGGLRKKDDVEKYATMHGTK